MTKPVRFFWLPQARAAWHQLTTDQRAQIRRLLTALQMAPMVGAFVRYDATGRVLRVVSAADVHLIHTLVYQVMEDRIFLVDIQVADWTPRHSDDP